MRPEECGKGLLKESKENNNINALDTEIDSPERQAKKLCCVRCVLESMFASERKGAYRLP